jgi:hypothetical protein
VLRLERGSVNRSTSPTRHASNRRSLCGSQTLAPSVSSVRSEIFVATHATQFPPPSSDYGAAGGAEYSAGRGVHAASICTNQHAQKFSNAFTNSHVEAIPPVRDRAPKPALAVTAI